MKLLNSDVLINAAYLIAAILFILSLRGLSSQETARRGNLYGIVGMAIAIAATLASSAAESAGVETRGHFHTLLFGAIAIGAIVGAIMAARVGMTQMPELVALLHSFVGLAAVLVGYSLDIKELPSLSHRIEIFIDVWIGAITTTGSVLAFLKLRGSVIRKPLLLPSRRLLNPGLLVASLACAYVYAQDGNQRALQVGTAIAGVLGVHLVAAIGGADMPVVVSMLNSYSGWTAAAAGFMLGNDLLIITGALVG